MPKTGFYIYKNHNKNSNLISCKFFLKSIKLLISITIYKKIFHTIDENKS